MGRIGMSEEINQQRRGFFGTAAMAVDVAIVNHNYRWRLGLAQGEPKYDDLEKRLAQGPIAVPTITLEGDANGAAHPDPNSYAKKFSSKYAHRTITGNIGHNLPQEAPQACRSCHSSRRGVIGVRHKPRQSNSIADRHWYRR
jgi:hypothetical protein